MKEVVNVMHAEKKMYDGMRDIDFSNRCYKCLQRANMCSLDVIKYASDRKLLSITGFGKKLLQELAPYRNIEAINYLKLYSDIYEKGRLEEIIRFDNDDVICQFRDCIDSLEQGEIQLIDTLYGLRDGIPHSMAETGRILGIEYYKVKRIKQIVFRKLKHPSRNLREKVGSHIVVVC